MGTNFYLTVNRCECCGRSDELHIGKRSAGWPFSFRAQGDLTSFSAWNQALADPVVYAIRDEYHAAYTVEEFIAMVDKHNAQYRQCHTDSALQGHSAYFDDEGYWMCPYELS